MSQTQSPSRKRPYRLQRVCRVWQFPRSTVHEHRRRAALRPEERLERKKRGPQGPCTDDELAEKIRELLKASPFHGEGYRKMWAQLRAQDIRTSKERVRRVMREHGLQVPQRAGQPRGPQAHDGTITTERPDQMWGTDLTTTVTTGEGTATVFVAVDHCSSECIGIHAAATGDRFEALEPIHQGVREHFGGGDKGIAGGLKLRHDHGSAYMSDHFQKQIDFLGTSRRPASCVPRRAMAAPSDSSAPSRRISCGSDTLPRSKSSVLPCSNSRESTTRSGSSSDTTIRRQTRCAGASSRSCPRRPDHPPNQCPETQGFTRGGQRRYSDLAIETCLMLRTAYHLGLRQTQGLMGSIGTLMGLDIRVPDYSTLSRRANGVSIAQVMRQAGSVPIHLVVDSTGLKIFGEGE